MPQLNFTEKAEDANVLADILSEGYSLWVGAGVTKQLDGGSLGWADLTKAMENKMEEETGVHPDTSKTYPERLQLCYDKLEAQKFFHLLRSLYYTESCGRVLKTAKESLSKSDSIPESIRQIAALGQMASQVVSFNIEPLSSLLLVRPAGPAQIIPYVDRRAAGGLIVNRERRERFARNVYHPHGVCTGDSIMTQKQYKQQELTLAYQLATHMAFGNNLVIAGKSTDGEYMTPQIEKYRKQINQIVWFTKDDPRSPEFQKWLKWCNDNDVYATLYKSHSAFWKYWQRPNSGLTVDEANLHQAWYILLEEAANEVMGGLMTAASKAFEPLAQKEPEYRKIVEGLKKRGQDLGEPGLPQNVGGFKAADAPQLLEDLEEKLKTKNIPIPFISGSVKLVQTIR